MAEFCLDCWNKMHRKQYDRWDVRLSYRYELCEGCGELKRVVITQRRCCEHRFVLIRIMFFALDVLIRAFFYLFQCRRRKKRRSK